MLPLTRALAASSMRSDACTSPLSWPAITAIGVRTSPSITPCAATVNTAAAPSSAKTLPMMRPSTYRPPEKMMSPRITTRGPISVSTVLVPLREPLPLPPNISFSLRFLVVPGERLVDGVAVGVELDSHALRGEAGRQDHAALELLEIAERERLRRGIGFL